MKKAIYLMIAVVMMFAGSLVFSQTGAVDGFSAQVQERERQLLLGLTPEQVQLIGQNAALFERMPDPGVDPQGILQGLLAAPGIRGMDQGEAAFAVMAMAGRHLQEDLDQITGAISSLNGSRQAIMKALAELGAPLAGAAGPLGVVAGNDKGVRNTAVNGEATTGASGSPAGSAALGMTLAVQPALTSHYGIEYWQAPLGGWKDCRGLAGQERLAAAGLLRGRLNELDGLLVRMTQQLERGRLRQRQFGLALEGMAQKTPRKLEQK